MKLFFILFFVFVLDSFEKVVRVVKGMCKKNFWNNWELCLKNNKVGGRGYFGCKVYMMD